MKTTTAIIGRSLVLLTWLLFAFNSPAALQFNGSNEYVTFGPATNSPGALGVTNFTIECWLKRTGTGTITSTGTGGVTNGVPLVTKGRGEADGNNRDCNWFLGISTNGNVLAADFEDRNTGLNHPVLGNTAVNLNVWQHAAVTYDQPSGTWILYLNGQPDSTNIVSGTDLIRTPRGDSIQHAALASALTSTGAAAGYFQGLLDEVRVWNYARSAAEIADNDDQQISSAAGLIARWPLNDGTGTTATNSVSGGVNGTLINTPTWAEGYFAPLTVSITSPANGSTLIGDWVDISATASPSTAATVTNVEFYVDAAKISEDASAPYTLNWCDVSPATYALVAVAMDDSGATATSSVVSVTVSAPPASGSLAFDGNNDYVTFGPATNSPGTLGLSTFTIECWFKRTGVGKATTTGTGGVTDALPLVTKGRGEAEGSNVDMNWFLGIATNANVLAADFEEGAAGSSPGLNHPVRGNTLLNNDVWYHAAATYDGADWTLYLNGNVETNVAVGQPPRSDSIQHAALATGLTSSGSSQGNFQGLLDEVRIWNYARNASEIADNYTIQITNQAGLVARWALNEGSGSTVRNAICGGVNGVLINDPAWSIDRFDANIAPSVSITNPANNDVISSTTVTIEAEASDTDGSVTNVQFYSGGALLGADASEPYTFAWNGVAPGAYALTAVATDDLGLSKTSVVVNVMVTPPPGMGGLYFDGVNDHVTFGEAAGLGVTNFTLECWFKVQGAGKLASTGTGGIRAFPLVTKGQGENEAGATNMNYFLGIGTNDLGEPVLAADFEDISSGLNHPVRGTALVASNAWQHAAVTYQQDGTNGTWVLYLNGVPDLTNIFSGDDVLVTTPQGNSIQHAALGGALRTGGTTNQDSGFLAGTMDEARIWNYARSSGEIASSYQTQITNAAGLLARWSLDDDAGLTATNSGSSAIDGTLVNGPVWVDGYTFPAALTVTINQAAAQDDPTGVSPVNFTVVFSEPVADFATGDVTLGGTASGTLTDTVTEIAPNDGTTYNVAVSGMTGSGTIIATLASGVAHGAANNANAASTSTDNTVTLDITGPILTITGAAADGNPMSGDLGSGYILETTNNSTIDHLIQFAGGTGADETLADTYFGLYLSNSTVSATELKAYYDNRGVPEPFLTYLKAAVDGSNPFVYIKGSTIALVDAAKHDILASDVAMTVPDDYPLGTYTVAGVITDVLGNETPVTLILVVAGDRTSPTVTINQAAGQVDPTSTSPINFTVVFTEPVADFATGDVTLGGTAPGTLAGIVTEIAPNDGTTYNVAVSGMTSSGTVIASVAATVAQDAANNPNEASTSTDNTVVFSPDPATLSVGPMLLPNGHFYAAFVGTANLPYTIEYADEITGPWQPLTNITSDGGGLIEIDDIPVAAPAMRFYRVVNP